MVADIFICTLYDGLEPMVISQSQKEKVPRIFTFFSEKWAGQVSEQVSEQVSGQVSGQDFMQN